MSSASLLKSFEELPDPRIERTKKYPLNEIILLIISAAISGFTGWKSIKEFGECKLEWLRKYLPFAEGIPADDTIARIVRRLDPEQFRACFLTWVDGLVEKTDQDIVAIDGKTLRGSHDNNREQSPIHMVSAWSTENSVVLGQEKTEEKSNEITAIPKLLNILDIKNCIVTIDAMGTQKKIAEQICKQGGDYLLSLKGNQGLLSEDVSMFFESAHSTDFLHVEHDFVEDIDAGHGRIEIRRCWTVRPKQYKKCFRNLADWKKLETIVMIESIREMKKKTTREVRYYISSCPCDARALLRASRKHWGIESMHWTLDVTFREDESRIRKGDGPQNIAMLRHLALNTLKKYSAVKDSIAGKMQKAALSDIFRTKLL